MVKRKADSFLSQKKSLKPYIESFVDQLHIFGDVLEIGFALGYAADRIQSHKPKHHTIIEADPKVAAKAVKWAAKNPAITIIQDTWESALPRLGVFDHVFVNDFAPEIEARKAQCCDTGNLLVKKGKEINAMVHELIPDLTRMKYSDSDIDAFFSQVGLGQKNELSYFLQELRGNGQISAEQYEKMATKYHLEKKEAKASKKIIKQTDCGFRLLLMCLERHMRKGSRFSCFSSSTISRFEIPEFFDAIVTNANLDYQERILSAGTLRSNVNVLVSTVEKLDA